MDQEAIADRMIELARKRAAEISFHNAWRMLSASLKMPRDDGLMRAAQLAIECSLLEKLRAKAREC
jgi:hypothetical protein